MATTSTVTSAGSLYDAKVAFIYIFNLIIGVGALTLPKAFANTGWILGIVALGVLGAISFITTTFMIEAMAIANAMLRWQGSKNKSLKANPANDLQNSSDEEETPLLINSGKYNSGKNDIYEITKKVEMGQMAGMFFNKVGVMLFYLSIILYLYGDLAIYSAAVPTSLAQITCNNYGFNNSKTDWQDACFPNSKIRLSTLSVYRLYVALFTLVLGPFLFFNIQKTKYLQILTTILRWLAFILMVVLALVKIGQGHTHTDTVYADFSNLPAFFGASVYSFMCQHSLPSVLTPVRNKKRLQYLMGGDYFVVFIFYALLVLTAIFCFRVNEFESLYTLNFQKDLPVFKYFLALFPVFTLSTNFPIVGITLRENLKTLLYKEGKSYPFIIDRIGMPLLALIPPILIAIATTNVELLVSITGSYAGAVIQYVIPVMLVYCGRKQARTAFGVYSNRYRSIFRQKSWIFFVVLWAVLCIILVTVDHVISKK